MAVHSQRWGMCCPPLATAGTACIWHTQIEIKTKQNKSRLHSQGKWSRRPSQVPEKWSPLNSLPCPRVWTVMAFPPSMSPSSLKSFWTKTKVRFWQAWRRDGGQRWGQEWRGCSAPSGAALGSDYRPVAREAELRRLRKMNVAFEEQNAVLQRHTQSMSCARERLEQELALEERRTLALQQQLQAVRQALTSSFASLPVPGARPRPPRAGHAHRASLLLGSACQFPGPARYSLHPQQAGPPAHLSQCPAHSTRLLCVFGSAPSCPSTGLAPSAKPTPRPRPAPGPAPHWPSDPQAPERRLLSGRWTSTWRGCTGPSSATPRSMRG